MSSNCTAGSNCAELTRDDVLQQNANVIVSVRAGLLMVEAQGVKELMLDDGFENTTSTTQRHSLLITTASYERKTPEQRNGVNT